MCICIIDILINWLDIHLTIIFCYIYVLLELETIKQQLKIQIKYKKSTYIHIYKLETWCI
jgi:hypothetical protein